MRKVTEETVTAFLAREPKSIGSTCSTGEDLILHGNVIASWFEDTIILKMCGWPSVTTRERLNGILTMLDGRTPWMRFVQRKGDQKLLFRSPISGQEFSHDFDSNHGQLWIDLKSCAISNWIVTATGATEHPVYQRISEPSV